MRQGQFTNEQIIAVLQEAEKGEKSVADLCKDVANLRRLVGVKVCAFINI